MGRLRILASQRALPLLSAAAVVAGLSTLAGCGLSGTNDGGYIAGDGRVAEYAAADRGQPVALTGKTLDGKRFDLADLRGRVVVLNVWWTGCGPCRREMPMLQQAHRALGDKVAFVGLNIRDSSAAQGLAFQRKYGVSYPSLYSPDGRAVLALKGKVSPRTIPATAVLDKQGRVAALIRGEVPGRTTLEDVIQDAGGPPAPGGKA